MSFLQTIMQNHLNKYKELTATHSYVTGPFLCYYYLLMCVSEDMFCGLNLPE